MGIYEMELALNDGYKLNYIDEEDFTECIVESANSYISKRTKIHTYYEEEDYVNTADLLIQIQDYNITILN